MKIKIFETVPNVIDVTASCDHDIHEMWRTVNASYITVIQQYLNNKISANLQVNGVFDKDTFKALVTLINECNQDALGEDETLAYYDVPLGVVVKESAGYLQRVISAADFSFNLCNSMICLQTVNALNRVLKDTVLTPTNLLIPGEGWID